MLTSNDINNFSVFDYAGIILVFINIVVYILLTQFSANDLDEDVSFAVLFTILNVIITMPILTIDSLSYRLIAFIIVLAIGYVVIFSKIRKNRSYNSQ